MGMVTRKAGTTGDVVFRFIAHFGMRDYTALNACGKDREPYRHIRNYAGCCVAAFVRVIGLKRGSCWHATRLGVNAWRKCAPRAELSHPSTLVRASRRAPGTALWEAVREAYQYG